MSCPGTGELLHPQAACTAVTLYSSLSDWRMQTIDSAPKYYVLFVTLWFSSLLHHLPAVPWHTWTHHHRTRAALCTMSLLALLSMLRCCCSLDVFTEATMRHTLPCGAYLNASTHCHSSLQVSYTDLYLQAGSGNTTCSCHTLKVHQLHSAERCHPCTLLLHGICRAGFIVVDVVLLFLVAAFTISALIAWLRSVFLGTFTKRKVSFLLDCLTCAVMILSKPAHTLAPAHSSLDCAGTSLCMY